jgi:hypothetical protein
VIAGVGNLLADEALWRAAALPRPYGGDLSPRSSTGCARRSARPPARHPQGRRAHRRRHPRPQARRRLPALRDADGARDRPAVAPRTGVQRQE